MLARRGRALQHMPRFTNAWAEAVAPFRVRHVAGALGATPYENRAAASAKVSRARQACSSMSVKQLDSTAWHLLERHIAGSLGAVPCGGRAAAAGIPAGRRLLVAAEPVQRGAYRRLPPLQRKHRRYVVMAVSSAQFCKSIACGLASLLHGDCCLLPGLHGIEDPKILQRCMVLHALVIAPPADYFPLSSCRSGSATSGEEQRQGETT